MNVMYTIELRQSVLGFGKMCALTCSVVHERSRKMSGIGPGTKEPFRAIRSICDHLTSIILVPLFIDPTVGDRILRSGCPVDMNDTPPLRR